MSAIYKLSIQGIRSFDSNDRETIEFGKPLTLIVGSNGSGKTTIIECLKYATTGDLPPNSKGGVFVHDPKITGEKDIRAQVKLAFTSASGLNMIVTRNIQLMMKKTTSTFKTLEGQLVAINKENDRTTLSTRSAELDKQVPLYIGVPKAILEYVIFCHQEDSLWPLSEPTNLKKKFDEIFQAMKFTKALDNLKSIKKDMSIDIKLLKQSVEHLKVDRDRSRAAKIKLHTIESKIADYEQEVAQIETEINKITEKSDILFKSNQDFQKVLSKHENLKSTSKALQVQYERLKTTIEPLNFPKSELQQMLDDFSKTLDRKAEDIEERKNQIIQIKHKIDELQLLSNTMIRKQGELEAGQETHNRNKSKMIDLAKAFSLQFGTSFENATNTDILGQTTRYRENVEEQYSRSIGLSHEKLTRLQTKLNDMRQQLAVRNQELSYSKADLSRLQTSVLALENELHNEEIISPEELESEKKKLDILNQTLTNGKLETKLNDIAKELQIKNDVIMENERNLEDVQERIANTNQQSDLFAKLALTKESLFTREAHMNNLIDTFKGNNLVKRWNLQIDDNLVLEFEKSYIQLQKKVSNSNEEYHELDRLCTRNKHELKLLDVQHNSYLKEETRLTKEIEDSLPEGSNAEEYDDLLLEAEMSYKTAVENLKMHQTTLEFNLKALEVAEKNSCCYLCSRKFETEGFKSNLLSELKAKTNAKFEISLKETVQAEKEYLDSLRAIEKDMVSLNDIKKHLKSCMEKKSVLEEQSIQKQADLKNTENINSSLKKDKDIADKEVRSLAKAIMDAKNEVKNIKKSLSDIESELETHRDDDGGVKTLDELQGTQKSINNRMREMRKAIGELQDLKETLIAEHNKLINDIKEKNIAISEFENSLAKKMTAEESLAVKRGDIESLERKIKVLEDGTLRLTEESKATEHLYSNQQKEHESLQSKQNKELGLIDDLLSNIKATSQAIDTYTSCNTDEELAECKKKLESCTHELNLKNIELDNATTTLNEGIQNLNDSESERRNLLHNIELQQLETELDNVRLELKNMDIQNAQNERERYEEDSKALRNEFERLSAENAGKLGEIKQLRNQVDSLNYQLRTDYKDVDDSYHTKFVELQARSFVTDDIDVYSRALDSAIMKYHGLKMKDINRIIDELWKRTYSGTDIDTIMIRSDEVSSGVRGKSYNYRVVMFKQDVELDMRGRCSAGQKVLASIIIRLALSETFGVNCGVIALDEPTTNLDEENIESLAKSLHNIIEFRRHQKNFQLIVITHDEKFLLHMDAAKFTDHFFKIKRDQRQKSQIEWVDISRVTD